MQVNGPAIIRVSESQTTPTVRLGISDAGLTIVFNPSLVDYETDVSGPTPADVGIFPTVAMIRFTLVSWDEAQLVKAMAYKFNTGALAGKTYDHSETVPPGTLMGQSGGMKKFGIESPYIDKPYYFPFCHLAAEPHEVNLGTKRKAWRMTWRAITGIGDLYTAEKLPLYQRNPL